MQDIPQIFNGAEFVEPSQDVIGTLDSPTLKRLDGVRTAYRNLKSAEAAEAAAIQHIKDCLEAITQAETYRKTHFPPSTPHDEWVRAFGSPDAKRQLMERLKG